MSALYTGSNPLGFARLIDASPGATYEGNVNYATPTTLNPCVFKTDQTNAYVAIMAAAQPFVWTTNDALLMQGFYEVD
jgi:hypothetical protein